MNIKRILMSALKCADKKNLNYLTDFSSPVAIKFVYDGDILSMARKKLQFLDDKNFPC